MKKIISVLFLIIFIFCVTTVSSANSTLKSPQGRVGTKHKPEVYTPVYRTNISNKDLAKINDLIKQMDNNKTKSTHNAKTTDKNTKNIQKAKTENNVDKKAKKETISVNKNIFSNFKKAAHKTEIKNNELTENINNKKNETKKTVKQDKQKIDMIDKKSVELKVNEIKKEEVFEIPENTETVKKEDKIKKIFDFKKSKKSVHEEKEEIIQEKQNAVNKENNDDIAQQQEQIKPIKVKRTNNIQDYETRVIVEEVSTELDKEREIMLRDLRILWVSAVQKSDTVYFAIMKLSNPNGEEVNKQGFKKILQPIIGAAPLIGQAFVNPTLTAGSIIGSNLMGTVMDDSAQRRLAKVNDADLVILARAIDELQKTLLMNYMAYKNALKEYEFALKIADIRRKEYEEFNKRNSPNVILANTFYTEAMDNQYKARQELLMKRVVLEQMVGIDALNEIENPDSDNNTDEQNQKVVEPKSETTTESAEIIKNDNDKNATEKQDNTPKDIKKIFNIFKKK